MGSTIESENSYRFTGEQFDETIGSYYLRQRFYNQGIGRFTRRDTYEGRIFEPLTLHKYLYTHNNPVNFIDPTGNVTVAQAVAVSVISGILADLAFPKPVLTAGGTGETAYDPALERILFSLIVGGVFVGILNSLKSSADEIISSSANSILSPDDLFDHLAAQQAKGIPPEQVSGYVVHGTKQLTNGTFQRNILELSRNTGQIRNFREFIKLLDAFEDEAIEAGASSLKIYAYTIVNPKLSGLLSNSRFLARYGIEVRQVNDGILEISKGL